MYSRIFCYIEILNFVLGDKFRFVHQTFVQKCGGKYHVIIKTRVKRLIIEIVYYLYDKIQ